MVAIVCERYNRLPCPAVKQALLGHSRSAQIFSFALLTSEHVPLGVKVTLFETFHMHFSFIWLLCTSLRAADRALLSLQRLCVNLCVSEVRVRTLCASNRGLLIFITQYQSNIGECAGRFGIHHCLTFSCKMQKGKGSRRRNVNSKCFSCYFLNKWHTNMSQVQCN